MEAEILFQEDGDVHVRIGGQYPALMQNMRLVDGILFGAFASWIPNDVDMP